MRSNLHDVEAVFQTVTNAAVCVKEYEGGPDIWIPLAQCEIIGAQERGHVVTVTAPEPLLVEKGLI